ncbi:hypothetical protein [Phormidesmis priestleyi]|uniref:hypothetical protein n=1 Tax=Phormidesmis priestleyi TaxID=268141 RepID=UPI00083B181B|nr:hypothetical protein [Phormidesmis priestleyi]
MARVHFIDGDKGGVGKTFCCRTLIQYFLDRGIDFTPIESDRYNPDVATRYADLEFEFAIFSDDERQTRADEIIEFAKLKPVIISLPSQVGKPLNLWLDDAIDSAAKHKIQFVRWFVSSGAYESLELLHLALKEHGANMPFVLVRNYGVGEEWDITQIDGLTELMAKLKVREIDFPKLPLQERNLLDRNNLTLGAVRTSDTFKSLSVSRDRVEKFLKKVYKSLESTGLVP